MEYVDIDEELARLHDDWGRALQIVELQAAFPDLRLYRDHYGCLKYCSKAANSEVDSMEMDSCHRCDGKPIKLWPYVVIDPSGTKLYSDPPVFVVADQNVNGFGEIPREGWEEALKEAGIGRFVIQKVRDHLRGHPPISYLGDDDEAGGAGQTGEPTLQVDDVAE